MTEEAKRMKTSLALLGLGTMGHGMAANLLKAGFPLSVWNRTRTKAEPLAQMGATVAESPAEAAQGAEVVFAMLADDAASRASWLGAHGALAAIQAGSIVVECSTLSPDWIRELHRAVNHRDLRMAEAPVTGSRVQAETGELKFLVGTDEDTLARISPVLQCMSQEVLYLGPVGSGAQLKLINNFLCAVQVASFAEALAWMEQTELRLDTALDFLKRGAPGSGILASMAERMTHPGGELNFLLRLMAKDQRYAHAAAAQLGIDASMAASALRLFQQAVEEGLGERDLSAVVEVVRRARDSRLRSE